MERIQYTPPTFGKRRYRLSTFRTCFFSPYCMKSDNETGTPGLPCAIVLEKFRNFRAEHLMLVRQQSQELTLPHQRLFRQTVT
jgi:hypothetical protein